MATVTNQSDIDACLFVIDNLGKNLGMKVSSQFAEQAALTPILETGNFDFNISSYNSSTIGDPDDDLYANYFHEYLGTTSRQSMEARWAEQPEVMAEVAAMIQGQSAELDPIKRKELVRELDLKIIDEVLALRGGGLEPLIFPGCGARS